MAKKYQIQIQLDDADAERKLKALAGLFGKVDRAAKGFADRAGRSFRDAAAAAGGQGGGGMAANVAKTSEKFRDLGRAFAATHTAFAGLNDDARKFGAAFVQVVNTQVGPALNQVKRQADAALTGAPLSDARMRAWRRQLDAMTPGDRARFDAEVAARAKARASTPDYKAQSDAIRAAYYAKAGGNGATAGGGKGGGLPPGLLPGEEGDEPKIDVGYYKVVADSVNKQIKDRDAAEKGVADANRAADNLLARQAVKDYKFDEAEKRKAEKEKEKAAKERAAAELAADRIVHKQREKDYKADEAEKKRAEKEKEKVQKQRADAELAADRIVHKQREKDYKADEAEKKRAEKEKEKVQKLGDDFVAKHDRKSHDAKLREEQRFQDGFLKNLTDREVKQIVSNEKVKRSNDARVAAALKGAGLEKSGIEGVVKSLGMMVARFAVYHLAIGKATELFKAMVNAIKEAQQEQDKLLKGFVDERSQNKKIAAQLGVDNDNEFAKTVLGMSARTGASSAEVRDFLESANAGGIPLIGENDRDFKELGKKLTREQYLKLSEKVISFTQRRGMDKGAAAMMMAETAGIEDVHGMGTEAGARKAFENFAIPFMILEHGKGKDARMAEQFSEFHSAYGKQFKSAIDEAVFQSIVAEGKPLGSTAAASRALLDQLEAPNERTMEGLRQVRLADGTPMMRGDKFTKEMIGQEKMEEIRDWMDRQGMTDAQRSEFLDRTFSVKTGLAAAREFFGTRGKTTEAERRAFAATAGNQLAAEEARSKKTEDAQTDLARAKADAAEKLRGADTSAIEKELLASKEELGTKGVKNAGIDPTTARVMTLMQGVGLANFDWTDQRLNGSADKVARGIRGSLGFGTIDTSDEMLFRQQAQQRLMFQIGQKNPEFLETYHPFQATPDYSPEYRDQQLMKLIRERDRLNGLGGGADGKPGANPVVEAIRQGNEQAAKGAADIVNAINNLKQNGPAAPVQAPAAVPQGRAPGQNIGGGVFLEGFLN